MKPRMLGGVMIGLVLWIAVSEFSLVDSLFLATPWDVAESLVRLSLSGRLVLDLIYTLGRALAGFGLSTAIGVPAGLFLGGSPITREWLDVPLEFLRSIPAPALFPLLIILFGIGDAAKLAGVVFACVFPVVVQSAYGVLHGNATRVRLAERMGFDRRAVFVKVTYPQALPYVFVGLRNAVSLALVATIVLEMLMSGNHGLGYSIFNTYQVFRIPDMYAYIVVTGMLGWSMNKIFVAFERRHLHWVGR